MNPTNLSQFYGGNLINPTQSVAERFALPGFKEAANKAGYDESTYGINMGNADANNKILANLLAGRSSQLINTSTQSRTQTAGAASSLEAALARLGLNNNGVNMPSNDGIEGTDNDPIIQGLNRLQSNSDDATKAFIASVQAKYQNERNKANEGVESYKGGLQQLGLETNAAMATPDLLAGHIRKATLDNLDKIHELDAEESKTIMEAKNAKDANDFKTLQAKMDYVNEIKKQKAQAIRDMYDNMTAASKASAIQAHDIYDIMQTLSDADKESFIHAVAQKYNLPVLSLVQALNDEKRQRESDDLDLQNKKSILARREELGNGSGGGKITVADAADEIESHLIPISQGGVLGDDGYMDPYKWVELRDQWIKNKLSKATFDTLYKRYLNPLSYGIAGFAAPKDDVGSLIDSLFGD